jgi:PAS domain S-box-containing protein
MNFLDMKTVVFSYTLSSAICTVVILLLWIQNRRRFAGLGFWLANFVMQWIAIILVMLRGTVPDIVSMVISNVLIIGGTILLYIGIERFIGKRSSQIHNAILLVIFALVHTYFTAVHPSLIARNINFSIGSLVIGLQGAWLMLYRADAEMRPITRSVGIVVVALCLVGLIRIFVDLVMPPADDFFHSNIFETLLILSYQMLYIVLTFTLFLMVNRCLFADLEGGIVARQQAEEALKQSEKKFFTAFQASPDAILITHFPDGQIIEVNESFVCLSGYSREEVLTSSTIELGVWAHPQDREECLAALQENHRVRDREYDFRTRSGQILNTLYSGEVIRLGDDLYILSVIRDITERKQAEARLRASELRYDQLVRRIPVGVYTFHTCADGSTYSFEYTSPQFNYLLGLEAEAVLRDANLAFAAAQPEDRTALVRANRQAITTLTPLRWEGRFTVRGETRWLRIEADPTPLPGGDSLWAGVVSDVTARRQAEQELLAREHELRVITDNIPVYIGYVDADLRYRFVNKKYVEAFGLNAGAIIGRHVREVLGEAYYDRAAPQIAAALTGQEISFESTIHLPQQGLRWLSVNYVPEITALGAVNGLYILVQDITERKQTEAVVQLRLRLFEFAANHSLEELTQKALDGIGEITGSPIGFYHFVEEDQKTLSLQAWSTRTLQEFCRAEGQGRHYSLDQAGVWVDCVYQRRPVIHNDYAALPHRKGMPNGHAEIIRELVVPTLREGRIVSILGVGNKSSDYDQKDVELVAYVADIIWTIVERKQAETQLQAYQHQLEAQNLELRKLTLAIEQSGSAIVITDAHGTIQYVNPRFEETSGYTLQEVLGQNPRLLKSGEQNAEYYRVLWQTITSGQVWHGELRNRRKDGSLYWESATIAPVQDAAG